MIAFHASPVEQRSKVMYDLPNVWKFTCLFISFASLMSTRANRATPIIANMNVNIIRRRPKLAIAGVASLSVLYI